MPLDDEQVVQMRVAAVVVDPSTQAPVLILRGIDEPRLYLPIFIGGLEATAIATVLARVELPRPLTHDLMAAMIKQLGWRVARVTVTDLRDGTFFAEITLGDSMGRVRDIDARPSDSIALALRTSSELFVSRAVLAEAGGMAEEEADEDAAEAADEGEEEAPPPETADDRVGPPAPIDPNAVSLDDLDPELFGKYKM